MNLDLYFIIYLLYLLLTIIVLHILLKFISESAAKLYEQIGPDWAPNS